MSLPHIDPADRCIAATAAVMDVPLLTADESPMECPGLLKPGLSGIVLRFRADFEER